MDPFQDPYARLRQTVFEQPAPSAESPTIRAGSEAHFFEGPPTNASSQRVSSSSPLALSHAPTTEEDLSAVGLAAMEAFETPRLSPGHLGADPFGTPRSRLSNMSLDVLDTNPDFVVTPPSPASPSGVSRILLSSVEVVN